MLSDASLDALARQAGATASTRAVPDARSASPGCEPHEEDAWLGRRVARRRGRRPAAQQVARCAITTQNPETGVPDLETLREIKAYRGTREADGKNIDFGVFGEVEVPGRVRVGDAVEPLP